jgi:hypothetical protein
MVGTTFLHKIIILCWVNKLNSSMLNFGGSLGQPKKTKLILGISFFSANIIQQVVDFFILKRIIFPFVLLKLLTAGIHFKFKRPGCCYLLLIKWFSRWNMT